MAWLRDRVDIVTFRLTVAAVDVAFRVTQIRQCVSSRARLFRARADQIGFVPKNKKQGWEDKLQKQFESMAKEEFGIELDDTVFLG